VPFFNRMGSAVIRLAVAIKNSRPGEEARLTIVVRLSFRSAGVAGKLCLKPTEAQRRSGVITTLLPGRARKLLGSSDPTSRAIFAINLGPGPWL